MLNQLLFIGLTPFQSIYALLSRRSKVIIVKIACPQKVQWHIIFEKYHLCGNQSGWSAFGLTIKIPSLWSPRTWPNNCFHRDIGLRSMLTYTLQDKSPCDSYDSGRLDLPKQATRRGHQATKTGPHRCFTNLQSYHSLVFHALSVLFALSWP